MKRTTGHRRIILLGLLLLLPLLFWSGKATFFAFGADGAAPSRAISHRDNGADGAAPSQALSHGDNGGDEAAPSRASDISSSPFAVLENSPQTLRLAFALPEFTVRTVVQDGQEYSVVELPGSLPCQEAGSPALPYVHADCAVPDDSRCVLTCRVLEETELSCLPPLPSGGARLADSPPPKASPNPAVYEASVPWPSELAALTGEYVLRGLRGVALQVRPFQYLPASGALRVCRRLELTLSTRSGESALPSLDANPSFAAVQAATFLNAGQLTRAVEGSDKGVLLLLFPDGWDEAVGDFAAWKRALGFTVLTASYPADTEATAARLSAYLHELYATQQLSHAVILGDSNQIPPFTKDDGKSSSKYTSDIPYCLCPNADGTTDYAPDFFLSRIPVQSAETLRVVLDRLQEFEATGGPADDDWAERAIYLAGQDKDTSSLPDAIRQLGYSTGPTDCQVMDNIAASLQAGEVCPQPVSAYAKKSSTSMTTQEKQELNGQFVSAWNQGASFCAALGHGKVASLTLNNFTSAQARRLTNAGRLPFFFGLICYTANFAASETCLGEAMFLPEDGASGASAYWGTTSSVYWYPPVVALHKIADLLQCGDQDAAQPPDLGALTLASLLAGNAACASSSNTPEFNVKITHLLGDCSQIPLIGVRHPLAMQSELSFDAAQCLLKLTVSRRNTGVPLPNVVVTATLPDGLVTRAWTDANGAATFSLPLDDLDFNGQITVRAAAAFAPVCTARIPLAPGQLDADGDGAISNQEILHWLRDWRDSDSPDKALRTAALRAWEVSPPPDGQEMNRRGLDDRQESPASRAPLAFQATVGADSLNLLLAEDVIIDRRLEDGSLQVLLTAEQRDNLTRDGLDLRELSPLAVAEPMRGNSPYLDYASILENLQALALEHPEVCRLCYVGQSGQGRDMLALRFSLAPESGMYPELLLAGGIHGDEKPGAEVVLRYASWLADYQNQPELEDLLRRAAVYLLPVCNPDGHVNNTRTNAANYDLNRNFPDGVLTTLEPLAAAGNLHLTDTASLQPEQQTLMTWLCQHRFAAAVHLHTGTRLVCFPYGNNAQGNYAANPTPHDALLRRLAKAYADKNSAISRICNACEMYPVIGELADWQYRVLGTLPLTVEISDTKQPSSSATLEVIWQQNRDSLTAFLLEAAKGLAGSVVDMASGSPLQAVIDRGNGQLLATDDSGFFFCHLPDGQGATATVFAPGYAPLTIDAATDSEQFALEATADLSLHASRKPQRYLPPAGASLNLSPSCTELPRDFLVSLQLPAGWETAPWTSTALYASRQHGRLKEYLCCLDGDTTKTDEYLPPMQLQPEQEGLFDDNLVVLGWETDGHPAMSRRFLWLPAATTASRTVSLSPGWNYCAALETAVIPDDTALVIMSWTGQKLRTGQPWQTGEAWFVWSAVERQFDIHGWRAEYLPPLPNAPGWHLSASPWPRRLPDTTSCSPLTETGPVIPADRHLIPPSRPGWLFVR